MFLRDQRSGPAVFYFQEAAVTVCLIVGAADRVIVCGAYSLTSFELETGYASFHGHDEYMFPERK